jgi:hypothetical protein
MKKITLILIFISSISNSQIANSYESALLTFRDNTIKKGEVKILDDKRTIKYRNKSEGVKNEYNYRNIKEVEITKDGVIKRYNYKIISGKKPMLMRVIKEYEGKINLYAIDYYKDWGGIINYYCHYYVNMGKGHTVEKLGSSEIIFGSKKFKKQIKKIFKKCPNLIKKVENKEFKRTKNIEEIIEYYYENCD